MVINKNLRYLRFLRESFGLEPQRSAALNGDGAKNAGDDGGDEFEDFSHIGPVDFNHRFYTELKGL